MANDTEPAPVRTAGGTQTLMRGLHVLEALAESTGPVGVGELSRRLGLPKSTTQRLLHTLAREGWAVISSDPVTRWRLSPRLLGMVRNAGSSLSVQDAAKPLITELGNRTGETVHLSVPDGNLNLVLIDRIDSVHPVRTYNPIGVSTPMYASSGGKAFLAALPRADVERMLRSAPLEQRMPATITDVDLLLEHLEGIRELGYATNFSENRDGVCAIGAAVMDHADSPTAAIALSMPASRFDPDRIPEWGQMVVDVARRFQHTAI